MSVKYKVSAAAALIAVALVWLIVLIGASFQAALETVAAVIAALATTWSAYQSRRAAEASAGIARDARLALALHSRPWLHVHLVRVPGHDGTPWRWVVTLPQGEGAARLRLTWTIDGSKREATRERLNPGPPPWETETFVDPSVPAEELHRRVGSIECEWQDIRGLMRWRSAVTISPGTSIGIFSPYDDDGRYVRSVLPFISNSQPDQVW